MSKEALNIAGCGAAAAFLALRALQLGFAPTMLRAPIPAVGGVEIMPASAVRLLDALGLDETLAQITPGCGEGLTRRQVDGATDIAPGRSLHVDRLKFRDGLVAEAVRRGARIRDVDRIPLVDPTQFSVDATGQRAIWSRPLIRRGRQAADIFVSQACVAPGTARLAILREGWAYLASDRETTTIGVVGDPVGGQAALRSETCAALGLTTDSLYRFIGRRPAFLQWTAKPFQQRRLAIGDAAFHHNPIGGRGLSFALGSAFAAAAALASCRDDPKAEDAARAYYEGFVAAEIRRHLAFLDGEVASPPATVALPEGVRWTAPLVTGPVVVNARVLTGEMFRLASGESARWAGGFDLLQLRELTIDAMRTNLVIERLRALRLSAGEANSLLAWALSHGLVEAADFSRAA